MLAVNPRRWLAWTALATALAIAGCEDERTPARFSVFSGKVLSYHAETGEMTVRGARRRDRDGQEHTIHCLITRDSEIYINDMLCSIDDIQLGDAVEMIGREDASADPMSFLVSYAYIEHPTTPAPPPDLTPASAPATQESPDDSRG